MTAKTQHPTLSDIKSASAGVSNRGYFLMSLARPFAPYLAWLSFRLGLAPRQVTYGSGVVALIIVSVAAFGGHRGTVLAPILVFVWELLDVTDGSMARALHRRDNFGGFVDYSIGIALTAFLPIALAIGAASSPDGSLAAFFNSWSIRLPADAPMILSLGAINAAVSMYMRVLNRTLEVRFGTGIAPDDQSRDKHSFIGLTRLLVRNFETLGGVQAPVLTLAALTHRLEFAIFGYATLQIVLLLAFVVSIFRNYSARTEYITGHRSETPGSK